MAEDKNLWSNVNAFLKSFWKNIHKKYWKTIEALPAKVGSALTNLKDTIEDVPAIAAEQAITAWPRFLDVGNELIYKPLTRNIRWLVTGKTDITPNIIDRIADEARAHKEKFFQTHDFNQWANRKYWALLGQVLEASVPLPAWAKAKILKTTLKNIPKAVDVGVDVIKATSWKVDDLLTSSKALVKATDGGKTVTSIFDKAKSWFKAFLSKDRKVKKLTDSLNGIKSEFKKNVKNLSPEEQARVTQYITAKEAEIASMTKRSFFDHLANVRKQTKISKNLDKIANPEGIFKRSFKGIGKIAVIGIIGAWAYELLSDDEKAEIESQEVIDTNVPNPFVEGDETDTTLWETSKDDTAMEEKKSGEWKWETKETDSDKLPTSTTWTSWSPIVAWEVFSKDWSAVPLLLVNGTFWVKKPDWSFYTLTTWVTDWNKRHKYTMVANSPLPF